MFNLRFKATRRRNPKKHELPVSGDDDDVYTYYTKGFTQSQLFKAILAIILFGVPLYILYVKHELPPVLCREETAHRTLPEELPRYHGPAGALPDGQRSKTGSTSKVNATSSVAVEFPTRYTLVLNSYKRHKLLQRAIAHYSQCTGIDAIRVVWCEDGLPPTRASNKAFYSEHKEVRYDIMPNASLNNRFTPLEGLRTEAVLSMDDDIVAPCHDLQRIFQVWKEDKRQMVGFYPRFHSHDASCTYRYLLGFGTLAWHAKYSMVLTKAAMLHRDYLEVYTNHMPRAIRDYVDSIRNCEDIAMSFLVANATAKAPHFVHSSRVIDLGKGMFKVRGISSSIRHQQSRGECLEEFMRQYGNVLPLVTKQLSDHSGSWGLRLTPITDGMVAMLHGYF